MKKLMRKLILSSFALGLAVVTLTTTTFAWYTSNTLVEAKEVIGTSATAGDALLMISNDDLETLGIQHPVNWGTTIENVREDYVERDTDGKKTDTQIKMKPLAYSTANRNFMAKVDGVDTEASDGWVEFTLFFRNASEDDVKLFIKDMTFTNTTPGTLPLKDILAGGHAALRKAETVTTYKIDVRRTLLVETIATPYLQTGDAVAASTTKYDLYNPDLLHKNLSDDYQEQVLDDDGITVKTAAASKKTSAFLNLIIVGLQNKGR